MQVGGLGLCERAVLVQRRSHLGRESPVFVEQSGELLLPGCTLDPGVSSGKADERRLSGVAEDVTSGELEERSEPLFAFLLESIVELLLIEGSVERAVD